MTSPLRIRVWTPQNPILLYKGVFLVVYLSSVVLVLVLWLSPEIAPERLFRSLVLFCIVVSAPTIMGRD